MMVDNSPNPDLLRSPQGLPARSPDSDQAGRGSLFRLRRLIGYAGNAPKTPLQSRWERRWASASGAWFAVLVAECSGVVDWRTALMVAATAFMIARGGDMLDGV